MTTYEEIECSFEHYDTKEKLYRIKITYANGGVCYQVLNQEQLNTYNLGGK
jgi:hypothetical protein